MVNIDDLKTHLGGIQTKMSFDTTMPFVKMAEFSFQQELGRVFFAKLESYPENNENAETQALQTELKYWAKASIAWAAYDLSSPHMKYRIGDMGLMKTLPANTTAITKWEYVDTREANLYMVDVARENFYQLLEELNPDEWKNSDEYKVRNGLFINSPKQLSEYVVLVGKNTRLFNKIAVFIRKAEEEIIAEIITKSLYDLLKTKLENQTALSIEETILLEHIRKAVANIAVRDAVPFLQLKVDEDGMREVRKKDGIREEEIASKGHRNRLVSALDISAEFYLSRLRKYLNDTASQTVFSSYYNAKQSNNDFEEDYTNTPHVIL